MKRQLIFPAMLAFLFALTATAADEIAFEYATSLSSAQEMSGGEKPVLLDFYTDW